MRLKRLVKNYRRKEVFTVKLLLDTTYLLPIFGIGVKLKKFNEVFPKLLSKYSLLYNPASLVEAKWIIISQLKRMPSKRELFLRRFRKGLKVLLNSTKFSQTILTNAEIEEIADKLLTEFKIPDYFDRIIYATAVHYDIILLTEDEKLHSIAKSEHAPKPKGIMKWEHIVRRF